MPDSTSGPGSPDYPSWTTWSAISHVIRKGLGGGNKDLFAYKDGWVGFNAERIKASAARSKIPPSLLAGVAWIEVGGDPEGVDGFIHAFRSFDWSGPSWVDRNLTISTAPDRTSFGAISIQLRRAAETLGMNPGKLVYEQRVLLARCLETDAFNIEIVARHLRDLILYDYPGADTTKLTDEQIIVAGSRYNRGTERALADILASIQAPPGDATREYSEYGRALLKRRDLVQALLAKP